MAKLNPSIIFSMTRELSELHEIGQAMLEQFGSCKIVSWRFPDRAIKDVEIDLEDKVFDDSEKYISLLELIIDRLYLIINVTVDIFNILPDLSHKTILRLPKNVYKPLGLSFGTLASLFWKRLQILTELKDKQFSSKPSSTTSLSSITISETNLSQNCTSCALAMKNIKILINKIYEFMEILKLESALIKNRQNKDKCIINSTQIDAMETWTSAILIDIEKIINTTQEKIKELKNLVKKFEQLEIEFNDQKEKLNMNENINKKLEKYCMNLKEELTELSKEKEDQLLKLSLMNIEIRNLEKQYSNKTNTIRELENSINQTIIQNEDSKQKITAEFIRQITNLRNEIDYWTELHEKDSSEKQALKAIIIQEQDKLKQIEIDLKDSFAKKTEEISMEKIVIVEENKKIVKELQDLQMQSDQKECDFLTKIHLLENEKIKLQNEIKLGKEREEILLKCPDLNGSIEYGKKKQNPMEDMEEQFLSNEIRIQLLQEQNIKLRNTVNKLKILKNK